MHFLMDAEKERLLLRLVRKTSHLFGYCDDLVIVGPNAKHINQIFEICFKYARKWKIKYNENKCNWMLAGRARIVKPVFKIHNHIITQVDSLIHQGIPFGYSAQVCKFFNEKFNKVERSFNSLHSL
jgi:hypothetical protein